MMFGRLGVLNAFSTSWYFQLTMDSSGCTTRMTIDKNRYQYNVSGCWPGYSMCFSPFLSITPQGHFLYFPTFIETGNKRLKESATISLRTFKAGFSFFISEILDRSSLGVGETEAQVKLTRQIGEKGIEHQAKFSIRGDQGREEKI